MDKIDFSEISTFYDKHSSIQKSAGEMLLELLRITENDDVLDLGCGTGTLTRKIREITRGRVVGVDPRRVW